MRRGKILLVVIGNQEISDPVEIREDRRHIGAKENASPKTAKVKVL
jgi:hypothetical protein